MADEEWSNFTTDVTASLEGKFNGQQYPAVGVLLLRWQDDLSDIRGADEIETLEMFKENFGFDTKSYEIPEFDSQVHLQHQISGFLI
jgi:hypothetical protein